MTIARSRVLGEQSWSIFTTPKQSQGICSVVAPPNVIEMTPPYRHMHFESAFNAGMLPIRTVGDPGAHGAVVTGVHGPGVSTPKAAAVSDAVTGLSKLLQTPNGEMLANGLLSMMVAAGLFSMLTIAVGITESVPGAAPIGHCNIAPVTTGRPMCTP